MKINGESFFTNSRAKTKPLLKFCENGSSSRPPMIKQNLTMQWWRGARKKKKRTGPEKLAIDHVKMRITLLRNLFTRNKHKAIVVPLAKFSRGPPPGQSAARATIHILS